MSLDVKMISGLRGRVDGIELEDHDFSARLAFGLRNKPRSGHTIWLVIGIADGKMEADGAVDLPSLEAPEENLEVVLGIAATEDVWSTISTREEFLEAVARQKFFVSGEAPFFVRHLPVIVEAWEAIGRI